MGASFAGLDDALEWLAGHVDYERTAPTRRDVPTLAPVADALHALGDPQADLACVHVTGTNGKGSTTAMTAALLEATGRRVGTFTSPDLHAVNERIVVAGAPIDDEALASLLWRLSVLEGATGVRLTRFELLTVGALLHFADEAVDAAVVEVGLGGTWDATNVVRRARGRRHQRLPRPHRGARRHRRGDRPRQGGHREARVDRGARRRGPRHARSCSPHSRASAARSTSGAAARSSSLARNDLAVGGRLVSVATPLGAHEDVFVSLHGRHQGANALCAVAAAEAFGATAARRRRRRRGAR